MLFIEFFGSMLKLFSILCVLSIGVCHASQKEDKAKKILILHSYPKGEWYFGINSGFEETAKKIGLNATLEPFSYNYEIWGYKDTVARNIERDKVVSSLCFRIRNFQVRWALHYP